MSDTIQNLDTQLDLYYIPKFNASKNFVIENIDSYLASLSNNNQKTIPVFQFMSKSLNFKIRIQQSQFDAFKDNPAAKQFYNYGRFYTGYDMKYYFFIISKKWVSKDTIELDCGLDTLNTFFGKNESSYLTFTSRTKVNRMHKNRFYKQNGTIYRNIDYISEGIYPNLVAIEDNESILSPEMSAASEELKYYLIYKNRNIPTTEDLNNPVDVYLCADKSLEIGNEIISRTIQTSSLDTSKVYYVMYNASTENGIINAYYNGGSTSFIMHFLYDSTYYEDIVVIFYNNNQWNIRGYGVANNTNRTMREIITINGITSIKFNTVFYRGTYLDSHLFSSENLLDYFFYQAKSIRNWNIEAVFGTQIFSIDYLDKTDSRIIKVIEIPYAPDIISYSNGKYTFNQNNWTFDSSGFLKLYNSNLKFQNQFQIANPFENIFNVSITPHASDLRESINSNTTIRESKLFHSDYFKHKYFYDSFGIELQAERLSNGFTNNKMYISFIPTRTINSRFLFYFSDYAMNLNYRNIDYEGYLSITRNNEMTLYNSSYINYIRNGFNYDVKTKQEQDRSNWVSVGINAVGAIASFAAAPFTGGLSLTAGIALAGNSVMKIMNAIDAQNQSDRSMAEKLQTLQSQAINVSGCDDIDLLSDYNGNKLLHNYYCTNDNMTACLLDLFHYTGYKVDLYQVPNISSRTRFNYLQCEADFEVNKNVDDEFIEDIKNKFKIGVTFIHKYNNEWDLDQKYENWETIFFN